MSVARTKILEQAQKFLARGQYDRAIAEYHRLVEHDPSDVRTWLKIGDLYTRKGARREACDTYARVAEQYAQQGFFLKAVAVYKQILKLDALRADATRRLAEMYEQLQLVNDALTTYEQLAALHARDNDIDGALATLGRMADLDPENIPVRIKFAEALSKAGRTAQAAEEFERGARLLREQNRVEDYIKVAERLLYHRQNDVRVARDLAELYLQRGDAKRALGKLQLCFKADPRDVGVLELLAHAFQLLGQTQKTISVFKEIGRIHEDAGRTEDWEAALGRVLELDPTDPDARDALGRRRTGSARRIPQGLLPPREAVIRPSRMPPPSTGGDAMRPPTGLPTAAPPRPPPKPPTAPPARRTFSPPEPESVPPPLPIEEAPASAPTPQVDAPAPPPAPPEPAPSRPSAAGAPPTSQRATLVHQLLTECEVYLRYRLYDRVIDQLRRALELDPSHVRARTKLKEVLLETGRQPEAIEELRRLADLVAERDPALAARHRAEADALAGQAPAGPESRPPSAAEDDAILFIEDSVVASAPPSAPASGAPSGAASPSAAARPAPPSLPPLDSIVTHPGLMAMTPEEFEAHPGARPEAEAEWRPRVEARVTPIEAMLEEAESLFTQARYADAISGLEDALAKHPGHRLLTERLEEARSFVDALRQAAAVPAMAGGGSNGPPSAALRAPLPAPPLRSSRGSKPATDGDDETFAVAERLAEEIDQEIEAHPESRPFEGSNILDVEAVFAQFKKGVAETVAKEDSDTHFDLGIAYKEMGLLDDAISEFELSMSKVERQCMAHTMVGLCFVEKGNLPKAIEAFKKGLNAPTKTDREALGLYFELGQAYELSDEVEEALYFYDKVRHADPGFRGVEDRIARLTSPGAASNPSEDGPSMEDVDRAFDELLGGPGGKG